MSLRVLLHDGGFEDYLDEETADGRWLRVTYEAREPHGELAIYRVTADAGPFDVKRELIATYPANGWMSYEFHG